MAEVLIKGILGFMLLLGTIQDIRKKKISLWLIGVFFSLAVISLALQTEWSIVDKVGGFFIGMGIILISKLTGGKIGMGDGMILCITGIGLGLWSNLELLAYALFAAAIVSIGLLAFKLADRKKSIPFVPFLLAGYLVQIIFN